MKDKISIKDEMLKEIKMLGFTVWDENERGVFRYQDHRMFIIDHDLKVQRVLILSMKGAEIK